MEEWRTENKRREQEFGHRLPLSFVALPRLPTCMMKDDGCEIKKWRARTLDARGSTPVVSNGRGAAHTMGEAALWSWSEAAGKAHLEVRAASERPRLREKLCI